MFVYVLYFLCGINVITILIDNVPSLKRIILKSFEKGQQTKLEDSMKDKSFVVKLFSSILIILTVSIISILILLPIWLPIVLWIKCSPLIGVISLSLSNLPFSILKFYYPITKKIGISAIHHIISNDSLLYLFILQLGYILSSNNGKSLYELTVVVYQIDSTFGSTMVVLFPVIIVSLICINIYFLYKKFTYYANKKKINSSSLISIKKLVFIFTISGFLGLYYINMIDKSFIPEEKIEIVYGAINITTSIITALIIPIGLSLLTQKITSETKK